MAYEDIANSTMRRAVDQSSRAADAAGEAVTEGYQAARKYVHDKGLDIDLPDFVRREPWVALAVAFAVGYAAAQVIRRVA